MITTNFEPIEIESNFINSYGKLYLEFMPSENLRKYICCYWVSPRFKNVGLNHMSLLQSEIIVPDGCIDVLFGTDKYGDGCRNILVGTMSKGSIVNIDHSNIETFGIRFYPGGLQALIKESYDKFTDKTYSGQGIINADYYDMSGAYGSGFLYSTTEDILKWIKALLNCKIITAETLRKMMTPYGHIWYMDAWAEYGCFMKDEQADEICANGLICGYIFKVWVDLINGYVVILLGNNDTIAISKILEGIKCILFDTDALIEIIPIVNGEINSLELLKKIEGRYLSKRREPSPDEAGLGYSPYFFMKKVKDIIVFL